MNITTDEARGVVPLATSRDEAAAASNALQAEYAQAQKRLDALPILVLDERDDAARRALLAEAAELHAFRSLYPRMKREAWQRFVLADLTLAYAQREQGRMALAEADQHLQPLQQRLAVVRGEIKKIEDTYREPELGAIGQYSFQAQGEARRQREAGRADREAKRQAAQPDLAVREQEAADLQTEIAALALERRKAEKVIEAAEQVATRYKTRLDARHEFTSKAADAGTQAEQDALAMIAAAQPTRPSLRHNGLALG